MQVFALINRNGPLASMVPNIHGDWVPFMEAKALETQLEAWHKTFGTTQLTHAQARLEEAEKQVKILTRKIEQLERKRSREQRIANLRND